MFFGDLRVPIAAFKQTREPQMVFWIAGRAVSNQTLIRDLLDADLSQSSQRVGWMSRDAHAKTGKFVKDQLFHDFRRSSHHERHVQLTLLKPVDHFL